MIARPCAFYNVFLQLGMKNEVKRRIENGKCMINGCYGNNVDEGAEMAEGMGG